MIIRLVSLSLWERARERAGKVERSMYSLAPPLTPTLSQQERESKLDAHDFMLFGL
jgi:hypothetical protein